MTQPMTRRRALKMLFCSSALMNLNLAAFGQQMPASGTLDLLALGDLRAIATAAAVSWRSSASSSR